MDTLQSMFPDLPSATLEAALTAHNNSLERTVDYLLSSSNSPTSQSPDLHTRRLQEEVDLALARRLQAEQDESFTPRDTDIPANGASAAGSGFAIPSLGDVQNAVKPLVDGVQYAGRMAVEGVNSLYREFLGDGTSVERNEGGRRRSVRDDETVVLRGEGVGSGGSARMRRGVVGAGASMGSGKKDA